MKKNISEFEKTGFANTCKGKLKEMKVSDTCPMPLSNSADHAN